MIIFVSCKDYLDLNPISNYNSGSFYTSQKDFELAVNGIYNEFQSLMNGTIELAIESRSDNVSYDVNSYGWNYIHRFVDNPTNESTVAIWKGYWIAIDRCNAVLDRIDNIAFTDTDRRSNLKGEAYFLRGYAYFQLGWLFGGMPIIDHQMKVDEIKKTPRSSQDETFSFAATDLLQAAQLLPEEWAAKDRGKATKYAAKGILARMYMFQKKYTEAKVPLNEIISSGKYNMATNYADCFSEDFENSPEHVFQIQYTSGNLGQGNAFVAYQVPEFFRSSIFPSGGTSGAMRVSQDLYQKYENGDVRLNFTIIKGFYNAQGIYDTTTMYFIKYAHVPAPPSQKYDFGINMPVLRYTDIKMMYAEVLNEDGFIPNGEAFSILNQVRTRAGLSPLTSVQVPDQESFRKAILDERRLEFACEFLRWFDLLRTGKAMNVMNTFLNRIDEQSGAYQMKDYQSIFAIPQDELNTNPDPKIMWQNPGY